MTAKHGWLCLCQCDVNFWRWLFGGHGKHCRRRKPTPTT